LTTVDDTTNSTSERHSPKEPTMTRLGYQIPNFTYPNTDNTELFGRIVAQAKEAEEAGFDRVFVMDHFYQLPGIGAPEEPMLECYTLLSALAQHTSKVRLSALVTGNTYRNPTLLAKAVTTLDHVSGGRATLGIGAGWFELEHQALGFEFGTFTDRFEKLEEALQIILPMLRGETVSLDGKYYRVTDAVNSPPPVSRIPVMIGGSGEKKTLRMVAQYADESNLVGIGPDEIGRKLDVLHAHCERLGRDRSEIKVTMLAMCNVAPTMEEAEADLKALAEFKGWPDEALDMVRGFVISGDPDTVGEQLETRMAAGLDGLTVNAPANGHVPGRVALLGEVANKAIG
jgi:F420-dependent oxidoreductase-like protein